MVAISLYRGNLHRVSDVPRRWLPPKRQISLKDFKTLLARRARALSRLNSSESNPTPISVPDHQDEPPMIKLEFETVPEAKKEVSADCCKEHTGERKSEEDLKFEVITEKPIIESDSKPEFLEGVSDRADNVKTPLVVVEAQAIKELAKPDPEVVKKEELDIEKVKRKKEVEERLKVLNDKKHGLVQLLKQVLNAEEELKRRNSTLGVSNRPQALLQVEVNNDSVSMTRNLTPEGNEGDDLSNHNLHSRRMNSMSPSSESPIRRLSYLQHNTGLHPVSRTSLGATGSPSRFTPTGNTANMPTSSVSGTNYVASSPSPVASGGTSTFRDSRFPSPWN